MFNISIKGTLASLFACAMTGAMLIPAFAVNADTKIKIDEKNFPDENFRKELKKDYLDIDQDGYLSSDEIETLDILSVHDSGVKDLTGIELLTNLEQLYCDDNELTTIDLSKNTKLELLGINNNKLENLDLSKNTELTTLQCENNLLKTLDLSKNTELEWLNVDNNKIDKLDFSKNSRIINLNISNNGLTGLDLSFFPELQDLDCSKNAITSLDLEPCPNLETLRCNNNKLTSLDLSACRGLSILFCQGNQIDKVDISPSNNLVMALAGDKEQKDGYRVYSTDTLLKLAVDNKTAVITDQITIEDNTKSMFLDIGAFVSLGFEGSDSQTQVTLSSSDKTVVKIGSNNTLVTLKAGSSNITAKVGNKTYKFKVTVYFKDVKDNTKFWFKPTYALTEKGVVKGYDNQTSFKPANKCTRAQMVTFIWRLMGSPEPTTKECKFTDIEKSDYFYKACLWGNENHIVEGYKDGTFGPQIVCARRHAVTFLWRLAGKPEPNIDKIKFTDVFKDINEDDYFYEACLWASEKKIVAGYEDNTFRPKGDCLRRQMVTFLYKYDKYVNNK